MAVEYRETCDGLAEADLAGFFVGWPDPPSAPTHLRILQGSDHIAIAVEEGRVVGFATAVSDGVLAAYIPLLEVLPSHHGRGIGVELVRRLLSELDGFYMVDASCDEEVANFYDKLGFTRGVAVTRRNYAAQSGRPV